MKKIILKRVQRTDNGTFGVMYEEYCDPFCVTFELPWHDNKKNISCIPAGQYPCIKGKNSKGKSVIHIYRVPGRDYIQIHTGNTEDDSLGCPLVGEMFEPVGGKSAVQFSKRAYNELISIVEDRSFWLQVVEAV